MWLSKPVYEALPYYYVALGLIALRRAPLRRLLVLAVDLHDRRRRQPRGRGLRLDQAARPSVAHRAEPRSALLRSSSSSSSASSCSSSSLVVVARRHRRHRRARPRRRLRRWLLRDGAAHVAINELVLAELDDVAVGQHVLLDALRANEHAVRAVQVLDDRLRLVGNDLCVMPGDEAALDLHVVVGRAADDRLARG